MSSGLDRCSLWKPWQAWVRCLVGFAQGSVDGGRSR
jgi:hypothetical protein